MLTKDDATGDMVGSQPPTCLQGHPWDLHWTGEIFWDRLPKYTPLSAITELLLAI